MVTIIRSMVLLSAVVAAVPVVAFATSGSPAQEPPAAAQVAQRFPLASEMFAPVPITTYVAPKFIAVQKAIAAQKAIAPQNVRRPRSSEFCASTPNGWPYVSRDCLVASDGTRVPTFTRS
jgi:hypothetical protein